MADSKNLDGKVLAAPTSSPSTLSNEGDEMPTTEMDSAVVSSIQVTLGGELQLISASSRDSPLHDGEPDPFILEGRLPIDQYSPILAASFLKKERSLDSSKDILTPRLKDWVGRPTKPADLGEQILQRPTHDVSNLSYAQLIELRQGCDRLGELLRGNQQRYEEMSRRLSTDPAPDIKMVQRALSHIGRMLSENEKLRGVSVNMKEKVDELMKELSCGFLIAAIDYVQGERVSGKRPMSYYELIAELNMLVSKLNEASEEIGRLHEALGRCEEENRELYRKLDKIDGIIRGNQEHILGLENANRDLHNELNGSQDALHNLQRSMDQLQEQYTSSLDSIKENDQKIKQLESSISGLNVQIKTLNGKAAADAVLAEAVRQQLEVAKEALVESERQRKLLESTNQKLQAEWEEHKEVDITRDKDHAHTVKTLTERYETAESDLVKSEEALQELAVQVEEIEGQLKDAISDLEEKDLIAEELRSTIDKLGMQIETLTEKISTDAATAEERYRELEGLKTALETQLVKTEERVESLEGVNKSLTEEIANLREEASLNAGSVEALERCQERCRILEQLTRDLQAEIVTLRQRIALLDPDNADPPLPQTTALKFTFNAAPLVSTTIALTTVTDPHTLFRTGSRWLDIAPDDPAFRSGTHTVQRDHRDNPPPAHSVQRVAFADRFTKTPTVVVWLTAVQMSLDRRWRLRTFATDISRGGFDLHIEAWADSYLVAAGASWVAYEKEGVVSGTFKAAEKGGWKIPIGEKEGVVMWPGRFKEVPRVLLGVKEIECDVEAEMGVQVGGKEGEQDMRWIVSSRPQGGKVFTVGGIYVAIEAE